MAIDYQKLNDAYGILRTLREEYLKETITKEELDAQVVKIKNDIREILGYPPIVPD